MSPENFWWDIDYSAESWSQSTEKSEKLNEAFKEWIKAQQKAIKKIKADEKKAKVFDDSLWDVIKKFLADWDKDFLITLIANLVEKNVPSDFILAIIMPISHLANEKIILKLENWWIWNLWLSIQIDSDFKQKIFDWINIIYSVAILEKEWVLDSIVDHNFWKPIPGLDKLFLEVFKIILQSENQEIWEFEKNISYEIFEKIIEKLESEIE